MSFIQLLSFLAIPSPLELTLFAFYNIVVRRCFFRDGEPELSKPKPSVNGKPSCDRRLAVGDGVISERLESSSQAPASRQLLPPSAALRLRRTNKQHRASALGAPFHPAGALASIGYHDGGQSEARPRLIARSGQEYLRSAARNSYR